MKVAVYGNNLNQGYWLVRNLRQSGIEATLFVMPYANRQEYNDWWSDTEVVEDWVYTINATDLDVRSLEPLVANEEFMRLYDEVGGYDILFLTEDGPALFSELTSVKKIFRPAGADLQLIPFWLRHNWSWSDWADVVRRARGREGAFLKAVVAEMRVTLDTYRKYYAYQQRQRTGIAQCSALILGPDRRAILKTLSLSHLPLNYFPFPMDVDNLAEVDLEFDGRMREKYADTELVFFHPNRQLFLKRNRHSDRFGKKNETLLHGYARFLSRTDRKTVLVLVEKGPDEDIAAAKRLVGNLGIGDHVEWIPEMPNKKLRAYYRLDQAVVCGYFNKHVQRLSNTGREASFYGRPLITGYGDFHHHLYGDDHPPHVFPAVTADQILDAMTRLDSMSLEDRRAMGEAAAAWFMRHHTFEALMPRYIELFEKLLQEPR